MATVRQSITALYQESQKSALDGAPMLAVLQSEPADAGADASSPVEGADPGSPAPAIAGRFEELRRLAEREAASGMAPLMFDPVPEQTLDDTPTENNPVGDISALDTGDNLDGIDLSAVLNPAPVVTSNSAPAEETSPEDVPIIEIPVTEFGAAPAVTEPDAGMMDNAGPDGTSAQAALPDEPPAPAAGESLGDLDIGDIQDLVRQAWEDETAIGDAGRAVDSDNTAAASGIESAMEEIAAAVAQSADTEPPVDVETMKRDIISAMRSELQAVVESDLRSIVKAAVAEAMAEMPAALPAETQAPETRKAPAKKAAAKKAASKKATAKKAIGKIVPEITSDEGDGNG